MIEFIATKLSLPNYFQSQIQGVWCNHFRQSMMKAWTLVPLKLHQPVENPIKKMNTIWRNQFSDPPFRSQHGGDANLEEKQSEAETETRTQKALWREHLDRCKSELSITTKVRTIDGNLYACKIKPMVYDSGKLAFSKFQWLDEAPRCTPGRWFFMEWWLGPLWMVERKWVTQVWKTPLQKMAI